MKKFMLLLLLLIILPQISALCNETQIDINSASLEELDKIIWIGNITANKIIDYRQNNSFDSIDELINISGIGETKLSDIKSQGLACVSLSIINNTNKTEEQNQTIIPPQIKDINPIQEVNFNQIEIIKKPIIADVIRLNSQNQNPKDIKTNNNLLNSDNIAIYGLIAFSILLGLLFAIKKIKKPATEFE